MRYSRSSTAQHWREVRTPEKTGGGRCLCGILTGPDDVDSPDRPSMTSAALGIGRALKSKMSTTREDRATASKAESG